MNECVWSKNDSNHSVQGAIGLGGEPTEENKMWLEQSDTRKEQLLESQRETSSRATIPKRYLDQEGCTEQCRTGDEWYYMKVKSRGSDEYMGMVGLTHIDRVNRGTPMAMAIVSETELRQKRQNENWNDMDFLWKFVEVGHNPNPQSRRYQIINFRAFVESIDARDTTFDIPGIMDEGWCTAGVTCGGINGHEIVFFGDSQDPKWRNFRGLDSKTNSWSDQDQHAITIQFSNYIDVEGTSTRQPSFLNQTITVNGTSNNRSNQSRNKRAAELVAFKDNFGKHGSQPQDCPYWQLIYFGNLSSDNRRQSQSQRIQFDLIPATISSQDINYVMTGRDAAINYYQCYSTCCSRDIWNPQVANSCDDYLRTSLLRDASAIFGDTISADPNLVRAEFWKRPCQVDDIITSNNITENLLRITAPPCESLINNVSSDDYTDQIRRFCSGAIELSDNLAENLQESIREVCACYLPDEYYDRIKQEIIDGLAGNEILQELFKFQVGDTYPDRNNPICWFDQCQDSRYRRDHTCSKLQIIGCWQRIAFPDRYPSDPNLDQRCIIGVSDLQKFCTPDNNSDICRLYRQGEIHSQLDLPGIQVLEDPDVESQITISSPPSISANLQPPLSDIGVSSSPRSIQSNHNTIESNRISGKFNKSPIYLYIIIGITILLIVYVLWNLWKNNH